jgi:hypothetical protein
MVALPIVGSGEGRGTGGGGGGGSGKIAPVQVVLSNGKLRYRYLTVNMIIVGRDRIRTTDIVPLPRVGTVPFINASIQLLVSLQMQFNIQSKTDATTFVSSTSTTSLSKLICNKNGLSPAY